MNVKELLDTDVSTLGAWARQGLHWWLDELLQMVPPRWKTRLVAKRDFVALVDGSRVSVRDPRGGVADVAELSPAQRRLDVVLPSDLVLTRVVDLPAMRIGDVQKMVRLELDRLTPFRTDDAYFDTEIVHRNEAAGTQKVRVGVLPRTTAERVMALLASEKIVPQSLRVGGPTPGSIGQLDFLGNIREASGQRSATTRARILWAVVAALLLMNVAALIVRDVNQLQTLRDVTASQSNVVTIARRLREKVDTEAASRTELGQRRAAASPLRILNEVTRLLPHEAWVQRFEWDGARLHLTGYAPSPAAVLAALKTSPLLHTARANAAQTVTGAKQPFDIIVPVEKVVR